METYYDGFYSGLDLFTRIGSPLVTSEDVSHYDVHEMGVMADMQYEFPNIHYISENSLNSSSCVEAFDQDPVDSWSDSHLKTAQSAFIAYRKASSEADVGSLKTGQTLHKRCFALLCRINDKRKLAVPPPPPAAGHKKKRLAAEHMIAERGRRIRFKQHFSNLHSLLPINSKNDRNTSRNSILARTTSYVKELKARVAQLEQHNQIKAKAGGGLENTIIYRSNEVTLEQCKENTCLVNIKTSIKIDLLTCPTSVLMKQLEQLRREAVEVLSIHSNTRPFQFRSNIIVTPKEGTWNIYMWQNFGNIVRESLFQDLL